MTYDASYILLLPSSFVYKKLQDSTYEFMYELPNDMSGISYNGDFIYNSTLSSSTQVDVLKKEITQLPVEMNGRIETNILKDSVYTDEGVIVRSDYSLDSTVSTVNNAEFGTYTVTYTASENSNVATAVRKVTVSPLEFNNLNYVLERFDSYVEQGANLLPGYELTIDTSNVTTSNTTNVGTFDVVYTATNDTTSHEFSLVRKISVEDTTGPVITLVDGDIAGNTLYTVERGSTTYTDPGSSTDGGETVLFDTTSLDMNVTGVYTVNYYATDEYGNIGTANRIVVVEDTVAPVITLIGNSSIVVSAGTTYNDPGATADTGETVTVDTSGLNMSVVGTYTVTYTATDSSGNTGTASRTVIVQDTTPPQITLLGANPYLIPLDSSWASEDPGATADGGETVTVETSNLTYTIETYGGNWDAVYSATDAYGNTGRAVRTVKNPIREPTSGYATESINDYGYWEQDRCNAGYSLVWDSSLLYNSYTTPLTFPYTHTDGWTYVRGTAYYAPYAADVCGGGGVAYRVYKIYRYKYET